MTDNNRTDFPIPAHQPPFRVGKCLVLPALNRIECAREVIQVEPRVMWVLVCLASRPNEVITREDLFNVVWADTVVCEEALTRTISELRRIFGDDPKDPTVIETIRKGGYRLIAPVTIADGSEPAHQAEPIQQPLRGASRRSLIAISSLALVTLLLFSLWGARWFTPSPLQWNARPLTSYPGVEFFPALSPDGSMVAMSWAGVDPPEGDPLDIYVMKINNGSPARVTSLPLCEYFPCWSPDGSLIAFSNETDEGFEVCTIPVFGGTKRTLARIESSIIGLDWSPDGQTIAYASGDETSEIHKIRTLSLTDLSLKEITSPPENGEGDIDPAFSPDGRSIAFIRINELDERNVHIVPLEGGESRKLDMGGEQATGVDWITQDELMVIATSQNGYSAWLVSLDSDQRTPLPIPRGPAQRPSTAQNGSHFVFEQLTFASDIWCVDIVGGREFRKRPEPLISSTQGDSRPIFSPDGNSIAFISDRSGSPEVWIADADGDNPWRLTFHDASLMMRPCWSPDGRRLAYSTNDEGLVSIYVADIESHVPRLILEGEKHALSLWSRSGDALYYQVDGGDGWEIWRVGPNGNNPRRLSAEGYRIAGEASDGRGLLCFKIDDPGIWRLPVDGGATSLEISGDLCGDWDEIVPVNDGLYFLRRDRETSTLGFYYYESESSDSLASLELYSRCLSVSPDGSKLLYDCLGELESDLVLVEFGK